MVLLTEQRHVNKSKALWLLVLCEGRGAEVVVLQAQSPAVVAALSMCVIISIACIDCL